MSMIRWIVQDEALQLAYINGGAEQIFDRFGVTEEEREALCNPSWQTLSAIGIPPVAQIGFRLYTTPPLAAHLSMTAFLPQLTGEDDAEKKDDNG